MQGQQQPIKALLSGSNGYAIPPYQRSYQWTPELWHHLIHDVLIATTAPETDPSHFLGILLLSSEEQPRFPGEQVQLQYSVIDGQQRLVTLMLWIAALVHHAEDAGSPVNLDLRKLCKLLPQKTDQAVYEILTANGWRETRYKEKWDSRVFQAYYYFRFALWLGQDALLQEQSLPLPRLANHKSESSFEEYWIKYLASSRGKKDGLSRSSSVEIEKLLSATWERMFVYSLIHDPRIDEPQATIFDTLNGNRTALEPLDHVRNSLFVRLERSLAENVYNSAWEKAEEELNAIASSRVKPGIGFLYDYLISKGEKKRQGTINKGKGAGHFNRLISRLQLKDEGLAEFIREDVCIAMSLWPVAIGRRDNVKISGISTVFTKETRDLIHSIRDLSDGPFNPLVLMYLVGTHNGKITQIELNERLKLIENYLVRQLLSSTPLSPLRSKVMEMAGDLDGELDIDSLKSTLKKSWIDDSMIIGKASTSPLYLELKPKALGVIFYGIEVQLSGSGANHFVVGKDGAYTIEHIYPQDGKKWKQDLAAWKANIKKIEEVKDTLGNLTVVTREHNAKAKNGTLKNKQQFPIVQGAMAPLKIHEDWIKAKKWTEVEIKDRTETLIRYALKRWPTI